MSRPRSAPTLRDMDGDPQQGPTWGREGERPGAPRAEDQRREQGVTEPARRRMTPEGIQSWVDQSIQQAARRGAFDFQAVAESFVDKLRSRSPYLFDGSTGVVPAQEQERLWAKGKARERQIPPGR